MSDVDFGKFFSQLFQDDRADVSRNGLIQERVLDALDDAPAGHLKVKNGRVYRGPLATIQWLAASLSMSDSAVRNAVHDLNKLGLVNVWMGLDPQSKHRRLYVSAVA